MPVVVGMCWTGGLDAMRLRLVRVCRRCADRRGVHAAAHARATDTAVAGTNACAAHSATNTVADAVADGVCCVHWSSVPVQW